MAKYNESSGLVPETGDTFVECDSDGGVPTRNIHNAKFLGCYGDFRDAILLFNGFFIGNSIVGMVYVGVYGLNVCINPDGCFTPDPKDDRVFNTFVEIALGIGVCFAAIGVYGALRLKRWATTTALIFYSFIWLGNVIGHDILGTLIYSLVLHTHYTLITLIKKEVGPEVNYQNVAIWYGSV